MKNFVLLYYDFFAEFFQRRVHLLSSTHIYFETMFLTGLYANSYVNLESNKCKTRLIS
jgi:hypothetical protein